MKKSILLFIGTTFTLYATAQIAKSLPIPNQNYPSAQFKHAPKLAMGIYNKDTLYTIYIGDNPIKDSGISTYYLANGATAYAPKFAQNTIRCCCAPCPSNAATIPNEQIKLIERNIVKIGIVENKHLQKPFNPSGTEILLYDQPYYQGNQLIINTEGEFDLKIRKGWNNNISSIQVPKGYFLTLYDVDNTTGDQVEIGFKDGKSFEIPDFRKLPTNGFIKWNNTKETSYKHQTIDFNKKTSFISIIKLMILK